MRSTLTAAIAWRYLLSKKSHGAVGTITMVSVCAMAVATAAIICVLSVFNGFRDLIGDKLDTLSPDILVSPARGKVFANADQLAARIGKLPEVEVATPTLADNALIIANRQEMPVTLKGVIPAEYARVTAIRSLIPEGFGDYIDSAIVHDDVNPAVLAVGAASRLSAYPGDGGLIFAPRREGRYNPANPGSSFIADSVTVSAVYRSDQQQYDQDGIIIGIDAARRLFQYETEASALEVRLRDGVNPETAMSKIAKTLGPDFLVKDRMRQQEMNFRMVNIEKWVSFMLLVFILLIACFNLISALSMLVLEKEPSMATLIAMGLSRRRIGAVFAWESIYVSLAGGVAGILLGLMLCLLQQHFGLVKITGDPDTTVIPAYPVHVLPLDVLLTFVPVIVLGLITAGVSAAFARSRVR